MNTASFITRYFELADAGEPFVAVTIVEAVGSTPNDVGSKMLVTPRGLDFGTVGGGRVEAKAIAVAQELLAGGKTTQFADWSLKADVGMTCGGRVKLFFETVHVALWRIVVFGAGHVTQALAQLLATLPCHATCIDPRPDWLAKLPPAIHSIYTGDPPQEVDRLPDDAYVLCLTQGHTTDLPVLRRIFETNRPFPYLGVIGSRAKAAVLRRELASAGIPADRARFFCPVGLQLGSNHPAEIAISIAAQLLEVRGRQSA